MEWITKMQESIKFIESHILDKLDSKVIAKKIDTSPFHYQRLFHIVCGVTLAEYIRRRRLTLAAQEIASSSSSIIDIALKYGYESHASFTKAFTRMHGVAPVYAREQGIKIVAYPPLSFSLSIKGAVRMEYKMREVGRIRLVGKMIKTTTKDAENFHKIPMFWESLRQSGEIHTLVELAQAKGFFKGAILGVCMDFDEDNESLNYMVAAESNAERLPLGYVEKIIEPHLYAVFNADGSCPSAIQDMSQRIFSEWFPATNYEHVEAPELEVYPVRESADPNRQCCDIWIPVK